MAGNYLSPGGGGSEYSGYVTKIFIIPLYGSVVL